MKARAAEDERRAGLAAGADDADADVRPRSRCTARSSTSSPTRSTPATTAKTAASKSRRNTATTSGWPASQVVDNGSGIEKDDLEKIFAVFVSRKGGRGTGLGLPVSQKILKSTAAGFASKAARRRQPLHARIPRHVATHVGRRTARARPRQHEYRQLPADSSHVFGAL